MPVLSGRKFHKNKELFDKIEVESFLTVLGVQFEKPRGKEVNFHCPFSGHQHGDENASAYMNKDTTVYFCHGCHKRGNAITFAADLMNISPQKVIELLRERYDPGYFKFGSTSTRDEVRRILTQQEPPSKDDNPILSEEILERFEVDWSKRGKDYVEYMVSRGFTPQTLTEWHIGYDEISDRITIPVRNERNQLVGFKARTYGESEAKPKYLVLGDRVTGLNQYGFGTYQIGDIVFGLGWGILHEDPYLEDTARHFVVCEGELNAIAVHQAGFAGVAISGSNLTTNQIELIKREADRLTLFFDADDAGRRVLQRAYDTFSPYMPVNVALSQQDAADLPDDEVYDIIANAKSGTRYVLES